MQTNLKGRERDCGRRSGPGGMLASCSLDAGAKAELSASRGASDIAKAEFSPDGHFFATLGHVCP